MRPHNLTIEVFKCQFVWPVMKCKLKAARGINYDDSIQDIHRCDFNAF